MGNQSGKKNNHKRLGVLIFILIVTIVFGVFVFERIRTDKLLYLTAPNNAEDLNNDVVVEPDTHVYQPDPNICFNYPEFCKDPTVFDAINFVNQPSFSFSNIATYLTDEEGKFSYVYNKHVEDSFLHCRDMDNRALKEECLGVPLKEAELTADSKVVLFAEENLPGSYLTYKFYLEFFKKSGEKLAIPKVEHMMDYPNLDLYYANDHTIIVYMSGAGTRPTFLYYDGLYWRGLEIRSNEYITNFYHSKIAPHYDIGISDESILRLKERWWPYGAVGVVGNERDTRRIYLENKRLNTLNFIFDLKNDTERPVAVYVRDFVYDDSTTEKLYSLKDAATVFPNIAELYAEYSKYFESKIQLK